MAIVYPTTDVVVSGPAVSDSGGTITIGNYDILAVDDQINLVSTDSSAIDFSEQIINILLDGDAAGNYNGIRMDLSNPAANQEFDYRVSIGQTGSVTGLNHAIYAGSNDHTGVRLGTISIDNAGEVTSFEGAGAFLFYAFNAIFSNSGSVVSLDSDGFFSNAVRFFGITNATFENTGEIKNWQGFTSGTGENAALSFTNTAQNVIGTNAGLITGSALAVYSAATQSESFTNSGTIDGNVEMSTTVGGNFTNSGTIFGDVNLNGGNDTFVALSGVITGDVSGGLGDDVYIIKTSGISLVEQVGEGTDLVESSVSFTLSDNIENLTLTGNNATRGTGNADANTLSGNNEDNVLRGLNGDDTMYGRAGDDMLRGGRSNDKLVGGTGDDTLRGGAGRDTLNGGDGDDRLIGGQGRDKLTGGEGSDIFVFNRMAQSPDSNGRDSITDFELGTDRIDLSGLVAGTVDFIGAGAFTGTGAQVITAINGTNTNLFIDVDGDAVADMKIVLTDVIGVTEGDFIL